MIETDETKRDYHGRFSRFWWPGIVDEHTARRAAAYGAVMALFQAFLMLLVAVLSIFHVAYFIDEPRWDSALSVALFVLLAWLIYWRLSRIAALFALVYYLASQIGISILFAKNYPDEMLFPVSYLIVIILLSLLYVNGIRGTFAYHRLSRSTPSSE